MRIGIFFGGQSREREVSFAGGRTVYDNLKKDLFEPVPIFVDGNGNFILLNWENVYKGSIRDFYPPVKFTPTSKYGFQIYIESLEKSDYDIVELAKEVGELVSPADLSQHIDFAFLALHGQYGEDGNIQGILEWYGIPYSGSGILPSGIGINKIAQHTFMKDAGFNRPDSSTLKKDHWSALDIKGKQSLFETTKTAIGFPFVVKSPHQGSSLGVTVLKDDSFHAFEQAVTKSFFQQTIKTSDWRALSKEEKQHFVFTLCDLRTGIGLPVVVDNSKTIYHPDNLYDYLENNSSESVTLESIDNEEEIIFEAFIEGREFSCIVIKNKADQFIALPPTEIVKKETFFDYRSKYLPGISRKVTPIDLEESQIKEICIQCESLCETLQVDVYARIDGFITKEGKVFLNDPNTTSGMMPSSFFFHQAAEIGLSPSSFITYIIRTSLQERIQSGKNTFALKNALQRLDSKISLLESGSSQKQKVAVLLGGYSTEKHISVESGRNIFEKLNSSTKYEPTPIFLTGKDGEHELYKLPINILLKDNADDIKSKIATSNEVHPIIASIQEKAKDITDKYSSSTLSKPVQIDYDQLQKEFDAVFIALHGRPGEDGAVQQELEKRGIPYNGSSVASSQLTINKFETNEKLKAHGIHVAKHQLVYESDWRNDLDQCIANIEKEFGYPIIAKPADDGCSSAVIKIKTKEALLAFGEMMFRDQPEFIDQHINTLGLSYSDPFPQKSYFLIEELIQKGDAKHFLEVTGGLLTSFDGDQVKYEIFEPSESLASGEILSLEEKFLAGEGQNITPSRFSKSSTDQQIISEKVRDVLLETAKIAGVQGYARIDAFVKIYENNEVEVFIIEINSLPGMTPATCIFHQTAINGYKPYDFIDSILEFGVERNKRLVNSF